MCLKIPSWSDDWRNYGPGFSMAAFDHLLAFRNEKQPRRIPPHNQENVSYDNWQKDPNFVPQGSCELFARRAVAEIGFLLIGLATLVECAVRIALGSIAALPCLLVGCLIKNGELAVFGVGLLLNSMVGLLDMPLRCLVAMVKNVCEPRFQFDDLALCEIADCR